MTTMEGIIRPFVGQDVTPKSILVPGAQPISPVRLVIGDRGGTKTFSYSGSAQLSSYMANVHTEKPSDAFDMSTGELRK